MTTNVGPARRCRLLGGIILASLPITGVTAAVLSTETLTFDSPTLPSPWQQHPNNYGTRDFANRRLNAYSTDATHRIFRTLTMPGSAAKVEITFSGNTNSGSSIGGANFVYLTLANGNFYQVLHGYGNSSAAGQMDAEINKIVGSTSTSFGKRSQTRANGTFTYTITVQNGSISHKGVSSSGVTTFDFTATDPTLLLSNINRIDLSLYVTTTMSLWADNVTVQISDGPSVILPTVTTGAVSQVTTTGARVEGTVSADGGAPVTSRGYVIGASPTPTITSVTPYFDGSGLGTFASTLTLTPLQPGTKYYMRAFATNSAGTAYGGEVSFTTLGTPPGNLPTVTTAAVSSITTTSATFGGTVTSDGGNTVIQRGVVYGTAQNPTTSNNTATIASGSGTGSFTVNSGTLTTGTLYYVRAFATNTAGTAYGNQVTFTATSSNLTLPTVVTVAATEIEANRAVIAGNVTSAGGSAVTERGYAFGTNPDPRIGAANVQRLSDGSGPGPFASRRDSLVTGTTYYYRAYAVNSAGTAYGEVASFAPRVDAFVDPKLPDYGLAAIERTFGGELLAKLRGKNRYGVAGDAVVPQRTAPGQPWILEFPNTQEHVPDVDGNTFLTAPITDGDNSPFVLVAFDNPFSTANARFRLKLPDRTAGEGGITLVEGRTFRITINPSHPQYDRLGEVPGVHLQPAQVAIVRRFDFSSPAKDLSRVSAARKLVIVIHGWSTSQTDSVFGGEFRTLLDALSDYRGITGATDWGLVDMNWWRDASTGAFNFAGDGSGSLLIPAGNSWDAAENAYMHGLSFGERLRAATGGRTLEQVHIIAHSAGNWAAHALTQYLARHNFGIKIQVTSLDAFIPASTLAVSDAPIRTSVLNAAEFRRVVANRIFDSYYVKHLPLDPLYGDYDVTGPATEVDFEAGFFAARLAAPPDLRLGHSTPVFRYAQSISSLKLSGVRALDRENDQPSTRYWYLFGAKLEHGWQRSLMHRELIEVLRDISGDAIFEIKNSSGVKIGTAVLSLNAAKVATATMSLDGIPPTPVEGILVARDRTFSFNFLGRTYSGRFPLPSVALAFSEARPRAAAANAPNEITLTDSTGEFSGLATLMPEIPGLASRVGTYDGALNNGDRILLLTLPSGRAVAFTTAGGTVSVSEGTFDASGAITVTSPTVRIAAQVGTDAEASLTGSVTLGGSRAVPLDLSATGQVSAPAIGRLVNLSIRTNAGTGAQTLIVGFNLSGRGTNQLLVRGVGPTLSTFSVTGVLVDPTLQLFNGTTSVAMNDNWDGVASINGAATAVGAFPLPATSKDAVLLETLSSGSYTAQIGGGTGAALVELYEADSQANSILTNVSARTQIGGGGDTLIAGFVVRGPGTKSVVIRAIGPSLSAFGVSNALADPKLEIYRGSELLQSNDNWNGSQLLGNTFARVGAFPLATDSKDAALLLTLQPGAYTTHISGLGGVTGVVLIEVYDVP